MTATCFLLLGMYPTTATSVCSHEFLHPVSTTTKSFIHPVLLGPVRALSYLLAHGLYALTLGALWAIRAPWIVSVPLGMAVRVAGALAYLCVASWALNENMLALLVANVTSLVDQIAALFGVAGSPSLTAVLVTMVVVMLVNSAFYVTLMHLLYEVILRQLGYETGRMPAFVSKWMYAQRLA